MVREDTPGNQRLVAYFVPGSESASIAGGLREFLKAKLPEYMVPSAFVPLKAMPLTPNGKVNRRALPAPDQADLAPQQSLPRPKTSVESRLVQIWETVLGVRPIGVRHNFFELGGHSLVAVKLMNRSEQAFGKTLPIATLLQAPTIEQLAAIRRQEGWDTFVVLSGADSDRRIETAVFLYSWSERRGSPVLRSGAIPWSGSTFLRPAGAGLDEIPLATRESKSWHRSTIQGNTQRSTAGPVSSWRLFNGRVDCF